LVTDAIVAAKLGGQPWLPATDNAKIDGRRESADRFQQQ